VQVVGQFLALVSKLEKKAKKDVETFDEMDLSDELVV